MKNVPIKFSKYQIATAIAVLFHAIGVVGIVFFKSDFILQSTPVNLLLMFALLIWTQNNKNYFFLALRAISSCNWFCCRNDWRKYQIAFW
ncbi:MAG: hypothetical protein WDM90_16950 [Ferruginibacter sp.]